MSSKLPPGARLGRYKIKCQLGAGGMGEVYLAEDTPLHRNVALKILPADVVANQDRMRRFNQEATAAASLNHSHIAHIYEIGEHDGTHFIAMEYIEGDTLRQKIHRERTELRKLLKYLQQVAEGLTKAHAAGIVHRDLKPDNIMITREGHAKILDFGLAKLIEAQPSQSDEGLSEAATAMLKHHSQPGTVLGTVGYMSPEQAQGKVKEIDHRSDIFSFGCVLFEAATRHKPFEGDSVIKSLHKLVYEPAPPIKDFCPSAPPELQRIVRRCLAKDADERYQTIKDVAIELKELRRELEGSAEIDTTVAPSTVDEATSPSGRESARSETVSATNSTPSASLSSRASSAEYIVSGIRHHKLAAAIAVIVLIMGTVAFSLYLHARNTEVAIESIAVLPFVNTSGDANTDYLSEGITESLINSFSQLPALRVIPRSTVFRYKGKETDAMAVGKELAVRAVLTGRITQRGDSLTVSVELVDVRDNKQLWGEQYNRKLADALAVQQEISREITDRLRLRLTGEERKQLTARDTTSPEAYQSYIRGRYYWNKRTAENLSKAMEQFQQAADKDPNYALAYVGLADCYVLLQEYAGTPASETYLRATAFAQRALQLDDSLAEAHTSLAYSYNLQWRWPEAEEEFKRAIALNPNYPTAHQWYSLFLRDQGRLDESLAETERAHQLDPLSPIIGQTVAQIYLIQSNVNSSVEQAKKVIDLDPNFPRGHDTLGLAYLKQGRYPEAIAELRKAVDLSSAGDRRALTNLGYGYAVSGKRAEAFAILKGFQGKYEKHEASALDVAEVYAGLGDKDQAFAWLEKDFQAHSGLLVRIRWQMPFETLRSDPRFADLLRRMGLKP